MRASGSRTQMSDMEKESKSGQMGLFIRDGGKIIRPTVRAGSSMQMATSMMEPGLMIRLRVMESIGTSMELSTKVSGKMTNSTVKESKLGQMEQNTMAYTPKGESMAPAFSTGLINLCTLEDF